MIVFDPEQTEVTINGVKLPGKIVGVDWAEAQTVNVKATITFVPPRRCAFEFCERSAMAGVALCEECYDYATLRQVENADDRDLVECGRAGPGSDAYRRVMYLDARRDVDRRRRTR